MSLTISNTSKASLSITNDGKGDFDRTWDEATETWDQAEYPWDSPKTIVTKDSKSSLTISNSSKN